MKKTFTLVLAVLSTSALAAAPQTRSGSGPSTADAPPAAPARETSEPKASPAAPSADSSSTTAAPIDSTSSTGATPTPVKPAREPVLVEGTMRSAAPAAVRVPTAPPPDIREAQTAPPAPNATWVPGSYTWSDNQWRWNAGRWASLPQEGATWVPGRYNTETREWTGGYWSTAPEEPASPAPKEQPQSAVAE